MTTHSYPGPVLGYQFSVIENMGERVVVGVNYAKTAATAYLVTFYRECHVVTLLLYLAPSVFSFPERGRATHSKHYFKSFKGQRSTPCHTPSRPLIG